MQKISFSASVLALIASASALSLPDSRFLSNGFGDFQARFAKKYSSSDELAYRRTVYESNLQLIKNFNAQDADMRMGENMFTDLTDEERSMYLGLKTLPQQDVDASADNTIVSDVSVDGISTEDALIAVPTLSGQAGWNSNSSTNNYSSYNYSSSNSSSGTNNNSNNAFSNNANSGGNTNANTSNFSNNSSGNANGSSANNGSASAPAAAPSSGSAPSFANLQKNVNWVTAGVVSSVKNQGQCGGCYAFSAVGLLEALYAQKFKASINLSEQEVIDCSSSGQSNNNSGCGGGLINNALYYFQNKGVHLETAYPYSASFGTCRNLPATSAAATAALANSTSTTAAIKVTNIREVGNQSLLSLLAALQVSPVSVAIYVTNELYAYKSGLFSASYCASVASSGSVNHAVLAVGYSLAGDASTNNKPYLLIKNSWGSTWGEQGYFKMEMPLVDAGNGSCNVTVGGYNFTASMI